jgi:hypothetical protein
MRSPGSSAGPKCQVEDIALRTVAWLDLGFFVCPSLAQAAAQRAAWQVGVPVPILLRKNRAFLTGCV